MIDITIQNFETELIGASMRQPVLLDIWAPWCGPCKSLGPVLEKLEKFCASRNRPMLELAVNWLLAKPEVATVIAGATRPAQVGQNVQAVGWKLTAADLAEIDRITA